jgi:hypothetical protein
MSKPIKDIELYNALCEVEEILRRDGWCKGQTHAKTGEHCLSGAVDVVMTSGKYTDDQERYNLWSKLIRALGNGQPIVSRFNDHPKTTFKDVLNRIKSTREKLVC